MNSGLHTSLYPHCYHQLVFASFDLKVFISLLMKGHFKRAIDGFNREAILNNRDANDQVLIFNETITNIMKNFIPNDNIPGNDL